MFHYAYFFDKDVAAMIIATMREGEHTGVTALYTFTRFTMSSPMPHTSNTANNRHRYAVAGRACWLFAPLLLPYFARY